MRAVATLFQLMLSWHITFAAIGITDIRNSGSTNCTGSATAYANGTAGPFSFKWSNGTTTAVNSGLCPGIYTVTVTAALGCEFIHTVTIGTCNEQSLNPIVIEDYQITHVDPNLSPSQYGPNAQYGSSIQITTKFRDPLPMTPWGTTVQMPKFFKWVNQATGAVVGNEEDLFNVPPGTYCVYASNGCNTSSQPLGCYTIGSCQQPPAIDLEILVNSLPICVGPTYGTGGELKAVSNPNGYPIITYQWSGPNGFTSSAQTIVPTNGLGEYSVTVTDNCGRTSTKKQNIECCKTDTYSSTFANMYFENPCWGNHFWQNDDAYLHVRLDPAGYSCSNIRRLTFDGKTYEFEYVVASGTWRIDALPSNVSFDGRNITITIPEYGLDGTHCATLEDDCGCSKSVCTWFGDNDINSVGLSYTTLGYLQDAVPWNSTTATIWGNGVPATDLGWYEDENVIHGCFTESEPCGMPGGFVGAVNGLAEGIFTYEDATPDVFSTPPCQGGIISCGSLTYEIDPAIQGVPIINWDATPTGTSTGTCVYPLGCLFPAGIINGIPDIAPVFVINPEGFPAAGDCGPPDTDCGEGGSYPIVIPHYSLPCVFRWICLNTDPPTTLRELPYPGNYCMCPEYNSEACEVVQQCAENSPAHFPELPGYPPGCKAVVVDEDYPCDQAFLDGVKSCIDYVRPMARSNSIELLKSDAFLIHPNPTSGVLFGRNYSNSEEELVKFNITIIDSFGKMHDFKELNVPPNSVFQISPMESLPSGVYYIKFSQAGRETILKVIKVPSE